MTVTIDISCLINCNKVSENQFRSSRQMSLKMRAEVFIVLLTCRYASAFSPRFLAGLLCWAGKEAFDPSLPPVAK